MLAGPHHYAEGVDDAEMDRDAELDIATRRKTFKSESKG
jgi:hypothetical protein